MSEKISQSEFMAEFQKVAAQSKAKHANTPANPGIIRLPAGIVGVAQLTECYFGKNENGKFWRAAGKIVSPETFGANGSLVTIKNLTTSVIVGIVPDKADEAFGLIANHLKLLAGEKVLQAGNLDFMQICELISQKKPHFRFSTSQGKPTPEYPTPRVWENWHGTMGLDNYNAPANSSPQASSQTVTKSNHPLTANTVENLPSNIIPPSNHSRDPEPWSEQPKVNLDDICKRAAGGDDEAENQLKEMAFKLDYTQEDWDATTSYDQVVVWLKSGKPKGEGASGDKKAAKVIPEANETQCDYAPIDPKNGKRKKSIECEVIEVDADKETMTLRSLTNKKLKWEDVSWDDVGVVFAS